MQARRHSAKWWGLLVLHNNLVHPVLPLAEVLDVLPSRRLRRVAKLVFDAHDASYPEGAG
jgi:hypothetical protein